MSAVIIPFPTRISDREQWRAYEIRQRLRRLDQDGLDPANLPADWADDLMSPEYVPPPGPFRPPEDKTLIGLKW